VHSAVASLFTLADFCYEECLREGHCRADVLDVHLLVLSFSIAVVGQGTTASTGPSLSDLGFNTAQTQGNPEEQARLDKRTHMLKIHQKMGLITAGPLAATIISGFGAGGKKTSLGTRDFHAALGSATAGPYFTTAYFAIRAPKIEGTHTRGPIRVHKTLAWIHGPG
jgi:hypothetical protein